MREMTARGVGSFLALALPVCFRFPDNPLPERLQLGKDAGSQPFPECFSVPESAFVSALLRFHSNPVGQDCILPETIQVSDTGSGDFCLESMPYCFSAHSSYGVTISVIWRCSASGNSGMISSRVARMSSAAWIA